MSPVSMLVVAVVVSVSLVAIALGADRLQTWLAERDRLNANADATLRDLIAADDTREFDIVDESFADFQQSIADLLDANPGRSEELADGLEAATAEWERAEFAAATRHLVHDPMFRARVWLVLRKSRRVPTT